MASCTIVPHSWVDILNQLLTNNVFIIATTKIDLSSTTFLLKCTFYYPIIDKPRESVIAGMYYKLAVAFTMLSVVSIKLQEWYKGGQDKMSLNEKFSYINVGEI